MSIAKPSTPARRDVRYTSYDELLADAERCVRDNVPAVGAWSPGQILEHLSRIMSMSVEGVNLKAPLAVRLIAQTFLKRRIIRGPMRPGFQLPAAAAKVLVPGPTDASDGLASLRRTIAWMNKQPQRAEHPVLGRMTREQWDQLHLTHASMHMSFLVPA